MNNMVYTCMMNVPEIEHYTFIIIFIINGLFLSFFQKASAVRSYPNQRKRYPRMQVSILTLNCWGFFWPQTKIN